MLTKIKTYFKGKIIDINYKINDDDLIDWRRNYKPPPKNLNRPKPTPKPPKKIY